MWFVQFFSIFQDGFGYLWPLNFYVNFRINLSMSINKPDGIFGGIVLNRRRHWQPTPVLLPGNFHGRRSLVGCSPWGRWESDMSSFTFTFHFHALEKEMATHSSVLAWRIPGMGEPGGLPSMGSHRVRHDWSDLAAAAAAAFFAVLILICENGISYHLFRSWILIGMFSTNWNYHILLSFSLLPWWLTLIVLECQPNVASQG